MTSRVDIASARSAMVAAVAMVATVAVAGGCWRSDPDAATRPQLRANPPEILCRDVGERWLRVRFARDYPNEDPDIQNEFLVARDGFAEQCAQRKWDGETRRCIASAARPWELDTCISRLPALDRRLVTRRELELLAQLRDSLAR